METNSAKTFEFGQSQGHSFWVDVPVFIGVAVALYVVFRVIAAVLRKRGGARDSNQVIK
jgi:hypothetical protein